jgi:hypothetical protein
MHGRDDNDDDREQTPRAGKCMAREDKVVKGDPSLKNATFAVLGRCHLGQEGMGRG